MRKPVSVPPLSRAYYFIYNLALNRGKQDGFASKQGESTHKQLWRLFQESPEPECKRLGQIAFRLKLKRENADYEPLYRRIEEDLPEVLSDAQDFADRLDRLPPRHPNPESVRR